MKNQKTIALVCTLLFCIIIHSGCTDQTPTQESVYTTNLLDLNPKGSDALDEAMNVYQNLTKTLSASQVPQALVERLNNDISFIKEARLSKDGYTIAVQFNDDTIALILTDDGLFINETDNKTLPSTGTKMSYHAKNDDLSVLPISRSSFSSSGCDDNRIAPASKKVLFINAARISNPDDSSNAIRSAINQFVDYGWEYDDIEIRQRSTASSTDFTPDDLLNLSGYGMVFYIGHGGHCSSWPGAIPGHHYIQCCASGKYEDVVGKERMDEYLSWRDDGKLIRLSYADTDGSPVKEVYMDVDLIAEEASIDEGTMIYMISCNSARGGEQFVEAGAGSFYGWDGKTNTLELDESLPALLEALTTGSTAKTDQEAIESLTTDQRTNDAFSGYLELSTDARDNYAPAWGSITIDPSNAPTGTDHFQVKFEPAAKEISFSADAGETIDLEGLIPGQSTATISAVDSSGIILETGIQPMQVTVGNNELTLIEYGIYGIILSADPTSVAADGTSTSEITATLRMWTAADVLSPSGETIACKDVMFITTLGEFIGEETVTTDNDGVAKAYLASDTVGTAYVSAVVIEDSVESNQNIPVKFGSGYTVELSAGKRILDGSPDLTTDDQTTITATVTDTSGKPLEDQNVYFKADWGQLQGSNPAKTNEEGIATITLVYEGWGTIPNPAGVRLDDEGLVTASLDGSNIDATLSMTADVKDFVTIQISGSEDLHFAWDGNATFESTGMNLKIAIDDPDAWRTFWRSSSSVAHTPGEYYPFNITRAKRGSTVYLYFEYVNNPTGYIQSTYIHLFNSWMDTVITVPSFAGTAQDPIGSYSFVIP